LAIKPATAISVFASAIVVGTAAALAMQSAPNLPRAPLDAGDEGGADAGKELVIATLVSGTAGQEAAPDSGPPLLLSDEKPLDIAGDSGAAVLGDRAPRQVRWGVILVQYAGAQGAPANARSKKDALELATKLAEDAKKDFHEAARHGDPGSMDDAGRIPRGVLEPGPELALFSLAPNQTTDPIETPRGYYIMRRGE
jgi:hypothetical protein